MTDYAVYAGHLVELVNKHTCDAGGFMGHEPTCGMEPVLRLVGWDDVEIFGVDQWTGQDAWEKYWAEMAPEEREHEIRLMDEHVSFWERNAEGFGR